VRAVPVLQEDVLVVSVRSEHVPVLAPEERSEVTALPHGFYQVCVRFGFMEEPDLPSVLRKVTSEHACKFDPETTTYYLQRETFLATSEGKMGPLREGLFSLLSRNARPADAYLNIPPINVVEIGAQYDL
jgi:KUP system potassium uptake protein